MLLAQLRVADAVQCHLQRGRIVAAVVLPTQRGAVWKLLGLDEVLHPQLGRVHVQLERQRIHHALDGVYGLGDAERAAVGDTARRLVRIHAVNLHVRHWQVIRARADGEQSSREFGGIGGGVRCAMVGDCLDAQALHLAGAVGSQLSVHVVVAREGVRLQVLAAILDPLHRSAGGQRRHNSAHVARIHRHFAAEPTAYVRRDDADLVLGDLRYQ